MVARSAVRLQLRRHRGPHHRLARRLCYLRDAEVCYMKPIGLTEQGFTVAFQQCMTPEAFQESQK
jgi:hypothetical protein